MTPIPNPLEPYNSRKFKEVAVVSLIVLAFDNVKQPDYKFFHNKEGDLNTDALLNAMKNCYLFAFQATVDAGRHTLCVSPIGDELFRPAEYTQDAFREKIVNPAVEYAHTKFPEVLVEHAILPDFDVPWCFFDNKSRWSKDLDDRMFINAWDCWSMLENGNSKDRSLDGWWGRNTAISSLGWPLSNGAIRYKGVKWTSDYQISDDEAETIVIGDDESEYDVIKAAEFAKLVSTTRKERKTDDFTIDCKKFYDAYVSKTCSSLILFKVVNTMLVSNLFENGFVESWLEKDEKLSLREYTDWKGENFHYNRKSKKFDFEGYDFITEKITVVNNYAKKIKKMVCG